MSPPLVGRLLWPRRPMYMHMHTAATIARNARRAQGRAGRAGQPRPRARAPFAAPGVPLANHRDSRAAAALACCRAEAAHAHLRRGPPVASERALRHFFCPLASARHPATMRSRSATRDGSPPPSPPFTRRLAVSQPAIASPRFPLRTLAYEVAGPSAAANAVPVSTHWGNHRMNNEAHRIPAPVSGRRDRRRCSRFAPARSLAVDIKVEVTGSNIKRIEGEGALPVQIISRDEIDQSGAHQRDGDHEPDLRQQQRRQRLARQRHRRDDVQQPDGVAARPRRQRRRWCW